MQAQVNVSEVITKILMGMMAVLEQQQMDQLKTVLQMNLSKYQIIEEETALSTGMDDNNDKIKLFLATLSIEGKTEATIKAYAIEYRVFFEHVNKNFRDITTNDIYSYLAYCKSVRKNTDVTLNNRIRMLRSLFKWLAAEEYKTKNPMLKIRAIKTEKLVKEVLTDEQSEIIRCSCKTERDLAIIDFLESTGMRIGEMVKLNRSDIDFTNGQCIVYGKGRKERPVYITGKSKVHLINYLESRKDDNSALFVTKRAPHNRLKASGVRAMMKKVVSNSKISNVKLYPHKIRRTMATNMINNGAPAEHVQRILGHASVQTTLQCYARLSSYVIKDAHRRYAV
ncbi:MAG TPA: tyrosine-type recombinase/integrase [Clostridiales bacterium]|nr:tyrosine-type recombinase/integrase [Clostridiales bacterium]